MADDNESLFWKSLGKALSKIPFDKLTPNHAFDIACDLVMLGAIGRVLKSDLDGDRKVLLVVFCFLLMTWSFWLNSPPRTRPPSADRQRSTSRATRKRGQSR